MVKNKYVNFNIKLNEKQQNFEEDQKLISVFIIPDPEIQIIQFQRLQPSHYQMIIPSPLRISKRIKTNSQRNINTRRNNSNRSTKKLENLNLFGNQILCELGIGILVDYQSKLELYSMIQNIIEHQITIHIEIIVR